MPLVTYVLPRTNITVSNAFIIGEQVKFLRDLHTYLGSHISVGWIRTWTYWFSQFVEQKSVKRQGLLKGTFALFQRPATRQLVGGWVGRLLFKCWLLVTDNQLTRAFIDGGKVLHAGTVQSVLMVIMKSIIAVWPVSPWLFQRPFIFSSRVGLFPIPWGHFSELCQLTSWPQFAPHVVHFSTWGFRVCNTAHSIWLRITSIALEEELRVLEEEDDRGLLHFSLAYKLRGWLPTASLPGTSQWRLKQHWFSWSSKRCYVGWKHIQGQCAQTSIFNGKCQRNWRFHFKIDANI